MKRLICVYKGNKVACTDMFMKEGYVNIFDIDTEVAIAELDEYYAINSKMVFKGYVFEDFSGVKIALKRKKICVFTFDFKIAEELKFERHDKGTWVLDIPLNEIEKVIVEKEYFVGKQSGIKECFDVSILTFLNKIYKYW